MIRRRVGTLVSLAAALALSALSMGCGHDSSSPDALAEQQKGVMGSPAPPEVRAQVDAQMAQQKAAQQAAQQAAAQKAAQQGQSAR